MKKAYVAPQVTVEEYVLNASIADNCKAIVTVGPAWITEGNHTICADFPDPFMTQSLPKNVNFYEDAGNCDCYTTGDNSGYFTS